MLDDTYFERELELTYNGTQYEVIRPLGHPMVFFHGETGAPIAALHFVSGDCRTFITERHVPGPTASFLGVIEEDKRAVAIVITNLLFGNERVLINLTHGRSGDGPSLNDVNCIEAGTSVKVEGDFSRKNQKLVLDSLAIPEGQTVADSVVQDEARVQGPKGTYVSIAVYPQKGSNYRSGTWKCVDLFARQVPVVAAQNSWHRRALSRDNDFYPTSYPSPGGVGYAGPGFGFGSGGGQGSGGGWYGPGNNQSGGFGAPSPNTNIGRAAVIENRRIPAGIPFIGGGGSWGSGASMPAPAAVPTAAFSFGITQLSPSSPANGGWATAAAAGMAESVANVNRPHRTGGFGAPAAMPTAATAASTFAFGAPASPPSPSYGGRDEYELAEFSSTDDRQSPSFVGFGSATSFGGFGEENTRAATLRSDTERVHVSTREITEDIFDTTVGSRLATLCLSVIAVGTVEMLPQLSKADALHRCMEMAHDTIVNGNKRLLTSLERGVHESEECAVCIAARTSVVFITCGHKCVCEECNKKLDKTAPCPMCRTPIRAKIHV